MRKLNSIESIRLLWLMVPVFTFLLFQNVSGQTTSKEAVIKKMQDVLRAYKEADRLSFNVKYRYSTEENPSQYIDSLDGSFRLNGTNYWYELDNTEFIKNDSIMLTVFKEDQIIYINGTPVTQSAMPLAILDSVLFMNQYKSVQMTAGKQEEQIQITFSEGFMYKNIQYVLETKTGLLKKIVATIHSSEMYDPAVKPMFESKRDYGILELVFYNYRTKGFDKTAFHTGKYLKKAGSRYEAGSGYNGYRVYNSVVK